MTAQVCRGCKRPLKRPTPTGYGPVCARRRGLTKHPRSLKLTSRPATVPPAPDALPGQDALPLFFHQPTLESL